MSEVRIRSIYYVEDSDDEVFLARRLLAREGTAIELVHFDRFALFEKALREGLSIEKAESLVVLDLNLKLCSGNDAIRTLRQLDVTRELLIGICSGSEDPADRQEAREAGSDFFVPKPLLPTGIRAICSEVDVLHWVDGPADGHPVRRSV